jgi:hypothetical protein
VRFAWDAGVPLLPTVWLAVHDCVPFAVVCQPVLLCWCVRAVAAAGVDKSDPQLLNAFMKAHNAHVVMFNTGKDQWEFHSPLAKKALVCERTEPAVRGAFCSLAPAPVPVP